MSRLDEEKLALLRRWGEGLTDDVREEVRAAGRAILMLSDEIERLHIDLWHARDASSGQADEPVEPSPEPSEDVPEGAPDEPARERSLVATLRSRIAALSLMRSIDR
jgi:hypothetical protein